MLLALNFSDFSAKTFKLIFKYFFSLSRSLFQITQSDTHACRGLIPLLYNWRNCTDDDNDIDSTPAGEPTPSVIYEYDDRPIKVPSCLIAIVPHFPTSLASSLRHIIYNLVYLLFNWEPPFWKKISLTHILNFPSKFIEKNMN